MPTLQGGLQIRKDREDKRAKHTRLDINRKRGDFPVKSANTSGSDNTEIEIAAKQMDRTVINQHTIHIWPHRLREILANPTAHQKAKDTIRNALVPTGKRSINVVYPLLLSRKVANEPVLQPFPRPNEKMMEKLFDLFDVENTDVLVTPVALDNTYEMEWVNLGAKVFNSRRPDYLKDFKLSGLVPSKVSEGTAQSMCATYLRNGIDSLTFDFAGRRLREGWMRGIIDSTSSTWDDLLIFGTNVPYFNWHGTFRNPIMPMYDLLTSVYGFDSFSGITVGYNEPEDPAKTAKKITRKRYCLTDTYGAYNKDGLATLLETMKPRCQCPVCRRTATPLDLYRRDATVYDLNNLTSDLKVHRLHVTHDEMREACSLIDRGKYHEHLSDKREASNELQSILDAIKPGS